MRKKNKDIFNPFVTDGYAGKRYFCDRHQETEDLLNSLRNGNNVTLYSPRRMGKTGLIWHVFETLKSENYRCYYIDIMDTWDLNDFINKFASVVMGSMDGKVEAFMSNAIKVFGSLRPSFSVDPMTGSPKMSLDIAENQESATLDSIFQYLKEKGERCFIAIDEFQQVREYPQRGTEALLRSKIQFVPNATFVFSGSRRHLITDIFSNPQKPFYESTEPLYLSEIDKREYYAFASNFFQESGRKLPQDVFDGIYDAVYGHTWYVQKWLNSVYYSAKGDVTREDAQSAIQNILRRQKENFQTILSGLNTNERNVLIAIAKEGIVKKPQSSAFLDKYELPAASTVKSCLDRMVDREIVYENRGEYSVYNRFLAIYLKG